MERVLIVRWLSVNMHSLIQVMQWYRFRRRMIRHHWNKVSTCTSLLDWYIVSSFEWYMTLNANIGKATVSQLATPSHLVYLRNWMLLHFCWDAWSRRWVIYRTLTMVVRWHIRIVRRLYGKSILASLERWWSIVCNILLAIHLHTFLHPCINGVLIPEVALISNFTETTIRWTPLWRNCRKRGIVLESKFKSLIFNHLFSSHLNNVPLLSNTHVFEVLETNSHLSI